MISETRGHRGRIVGGTFIRLNRDANGRRAASNSEDDFGGMFWWKRSRLSGSSELCADVGVGNRLEGGRKPVRESLVSLILLFGYVLNGWAEITVALYSSVGRKRGTTMGKGQVVEW